MKNAVESLQTVFLKVRNDGGDVRIVCLEAGGEHQFSRRTQDSVDLPSDASTGLKILVERQANESAQCHVLATSRRLVVASNCTPACSRIHVSMR